MVTNSFEFDLLASRAASMLGIGEEVLRREGRTGGPRTFQREPQPVRVVAQARDAGARSEMGLVALAVLHPALRPEISAASAKQSFDDPSLAAIIAEICREDCSQGAIETRIAEGLTEEQQAQISAAVVGPLMDDPEHANRLLRDYITALERRQRGREVEGLRRTAAAASSDIRGQDDAADEAQKVILLRRSGATQQPS